MTPTTRLNRAARLAILLLCGAALGAAQPERPQPPVKDAPPAGAPDDRTALRARLERRLEETRRIQARLESAIKRLDEGASTETVRGEVEPDRARGFGPDGARRDGMRHREGPGGPDRPGGADRPGADRPRLDKGQVLEFIKRNNPAWAARLEQALKDNPPVGERIIARLEPQVRETMADPDPQVRELKIAELGNGFETLGAMRDLGAAIRSGQPTAELESNLRALIGRHYDLQLKLREKEIARLEERLKQLRDEVGEKRPQREAFVEERLEQIRRRAMERRSPGEGGKPDGQTERKGEPRP